MGIEVYRADHVGSLLRPNNLKEAREKYTNGEISFKTLRSVEDKEIARVVEKQKSLGLQAVSDGEFRRAWWHFDFLEGLGGVEGSDSGDGIQFNNTTTKARQIKVTNTLKYEPHPELENFKYLQKVAQGTVAKYAIPSPNMLHFRGEISQDIYPDEEVFFDDLVATYRQILQEFYNAGCRYLQLDDTSWGYLCSEEQRKKLISEGKDPDVLKEKYLNTLNRVVEDKPEDFKITMHICRGNFRSTWITSGGYEPVAKEIFGRLNIDGFFLEYDSDRAGDFKPLRHINRDNVFIVLGLVTSKEGSLENPENIKKRIEEATEYVPLEQLALSPQCGFASTEEGNVLSEDDQWKKIQHVVQIAQDVWK